MRFYYPKSLVQYLLSCRCDISNKLLGQLESPYKTHYDITDVIPDTGTLFPVDSSLPWAPSATRVLIATDNSTSQRASVEAALYISIKVNLLQVHDRNAVSLSPTMQELC